MGLSHLQTVADTDAMKSPQPALMLRSTSAAGERFGLSGRTIARYVRDAADFPQPIRVNKRTLLYPVAELDAFVEARRTPRKGDK